MPVGKSIFSDSAAIVIAATMLINAGASPTQGIMAGEEIEMPVLQILGSKRIKSMENSERYRLLVSDGQFLNSFAMLATQLNEFVSDGKLSDNTIVRVDKYITSMVNKSEPGQKKRVLIVLGLEVLNAGAEVGRKIGNPVALTEGSAAAVASAAQSGMQMDTTPAASSSFNKQPASSYGGGNNSAFGASQAGGSIGSGQVTHPISSLSPYQNKWVIKVRVTSKGPMRSWNNAKGEGKLFSMDLMDESGEIRATAFKEQAEKYFSLVEVDKIYYISRGQLKPANKQFNTLKNDYELTFGNDTVMQECAAEELGNVPAVKYDFVPIADLAALEANRTADVVAVCRDVGDVFRFTAKTSGKEMVKREITLVDSSNAAIGLTLWGAEAETFDGCGQPIILVKNGRINEFQGGKTLSLSGGSVMKVNPDIPEGHKLRGWFDNGGADNVGASISVRTGGSSYGAAEWMDFSEVTAQDLGGGNKPDYYQARVVVEKAKMENAFYKACPTPDCNKKIVEGGGDGSTTYRCEKCNAEFGTFKYRLLLNVSASLCVCLFVLSI